MLLSIALSSVTIFCKADSVDITVSICNVGKGSIFPRTPVKKPNVFVDGLTLSISGLGGSCFLHLLQNDDVVFSSYVPAGNSSIEFPSTLSGNYELYLIPDSDVSYYFWGFINID